MNLLMKQLEMLHLGGNGMIPQQSSPTTVASTNNISTLTDQMMMLEIDDIDETVSCGGAAHLPEESMNQSADSGGN